MNRIALCTVMLFAALPALAQAPFTPPPLSRAVPDAPLDLGSGKIGWVENFNRPDGTRQFTDLTGNQGTVGWSNRATDSNYGNDSGYMGAYNGKFYFTQPSDIGAPDAHLRTGLLDQIGVGSGSGTTAFSVALEVSFGDGDWSFFDGGGDDVGFLDLAIETHNSGGATLAQRPRLLFRPAVGLQFIGASSGTDFIDAASLASAVGKTYNSTDSFNLLLTFDAATDNIQAYVDGTLFLDATFDNVGGLADFEDISRVAMQTGTFNEWNLPGDPFFGKMWYDNLVVTNFVATPAEIASIIPEPTTLVLLGIAALMLRRRS